MENVDDDTTRAAIGPYQVISVKESCEVATLSVNYAHKMIKRVKGEALVSEDMENAFNTMDRQMTYEETQQVAPQTTRWYVFLYGKERIIDFDDNHRLTIQQGMFQGLSSSNFYFCMGRNKIDKNIDTKMLTLAPTYKANYKSRYVDDGITSMQYKFIPTYLRPFFAVTRQITRVTKKA